MAKPAAIPLLCLCALLYLSCGPTVNAATLLDSVQPIYAVTEKFLDFIQPYDKAILLDEVQTALLNGTTKVNGTQPYDWRGAITRYWNAMMGYFLLVCIGLFLILLVPIGGLIACCCRCCCHRCGGKGRRMARQGSAWRRGLYGVLLVLLAIAMVLGVVLAFISNQLVRQQMDYTQGDTLLANFSGTLADMADLLAEVPVRARANSASALATLVAAVLPATSGSMVMLRSLLGLSSKADAALATARAAMQQLSLATNYSDSFVRTHPAYAVSLDDLAAMLTLLRTNLTSAGCPYNAIQTDCDIIRDQLPGLRVTHNANNTGYDTLVRLNTMLNSVDSVKLTRDLISAQGALDNVSSVALGFITTQVNEIRNNLNGTAELEKIWSSVDRLFNALGGFFGNSTFNVHNSSVMDPVTRTNRSLEVVVANLDLIRYSVFLVIAIVASLVILLWFGGVVYGFCGEPPYEDARCCNRGVGASLLMVGTAISFVCYALLLAVILVLFLAGGLVDTEACRYLTGRAGPGGYVQLDNNLNQIMQYTSPELSKYSLNLVSGLLGGCSSGNSSITAALNIQNLVQASNIDGLISQFVNHTNILLQNRRLDLVSGVALNLNLTSVEYVAVTASAQSLLAFRAELQKLLIAGSDQVFTAIQNISVMASKPEDKAQYTALFAYLNSRVRAAEALADAELNNILALDSSLAKLNASAVGVTGSLQETDISVHTPITLQQAIEEAMINLTAQLQGVIRDTVASVIGASADCLSVNAKLKTLVRGPCVNFLRPLNGFWTGMGVCLICMLPCLILTVKLANLYRKTHKYQADDVDGYHTCRNPTYEQFYRVSTLSYATAKRQA